MLELLGTSARAGGSEPAEWSIEANPEDLNDEFLLILAASGVDRLSVGVQSLEQEARCVAGRRGSARDTMKQLEFLARDWRARWSADLMFGLPGQTSPGIARDAQWLAELGAGHVSLYELTLEPGTPLHTAAVAGSVRLPDEDERADLYEAAAEVLAGAGYKRYEISNWARPGNESLHNEVYWTMGDWLAVGPSGVGNVTCGNGNFLRLENSSDDERYWNDPAGSVTEVLVSGTEAMFECLMTALRTAGGFDLNRFRDRFGLDACTVFGTLHEDFPELIEYTGSSLRATERGMDMLNVPLVAALANAECYKKSFDTCNGASL
jgi:oxygen-independent coproporphyrinogen-3 oxidase